MFDGALQRQGLAKADLELYREQVAGFQVRHFLLQDDGATMEAQVCDTSAELQRRLIPGEGGEFGLVRFGDFKPVILAPLQMKELHIRAQNGDLLPDVNGGFKKVSLPSEEEIAKEFFFLQRFGGARSKGAEQFAQVRDAGGDETVNFIALALTDNLPMGCRQVLKETLALLRTDF